MTRLANGRIGLMMEDEENDEVYYTHNPEEPEVGDKFFTEVEKNYEDA